MTSGKRHVVIGTLDQTASSASNVLMTIMVARISTQSEFGLFSLILMAYALTLGINRTLLSEPYTVWYGRFMDEEQSVSAARTLGAFAAMTGFIMMVLTVILLILFVGRPTQTASIFLLMCFPALAIQDFLRFVAFSWRRTDLALIGDGLWLGGVALAGAGASVSVITTATTVVAFWCASGVLSAAVLGALLRRSRRLAGSADHALSMAACGVPAMLRQGRVAGLEYLVIAGGLQFAFYVASAKLGVSSVAGPRGALLLLGPLTVLSMGITQAIMPLAAARSDGRSRIVSNMQLFFVASTAGLVGVLLCIPDQLGVQLLGASWLPSKSVLFAIGSSSALVGMSIPLLMNIRVYRASHILFRRRVIVGILYPVAAALASPMGVQWFVWSLVGIQFLDTLVIWVTEWRLRPSRLGAIRPYYGMRFD